MPYRFLINENGVPFGSSELASQRSILESYDDNVRIEYRNQNAQAIAEHEAEKLLIVSGPGTGKSYLFLNRIKHWFCRDANSKVLTTSFVRKLVADLQNDIQNDSNLSDTQKKNISVFTLHKFARSIVEQNRGTSEWQFEPHFHIISQVWKAVVWKDVLDFYPTYNASQYTWEKFEDQLHNNLFDQAEEWRQLRNKYFQLCRFFNATGFADLILRAKDALIETPTIVDYNSLIIDEYQDFNPAEKELILKLAAYSRGIVIVGDDDQVLYEKLKSSKPQLIRELYNDPNFVNSMLPFCSRCSSFITKTAEYFISQSREQTSIDKIYLPIHSDDNNPKVQVIACATPQTAVSYVEKFISDHRNFIEERKTQLEAGEESDPFLLILSPTKDVKFYGKSRNTLYKISSGYKAENRSFSDDYYKILNYYSLSNYPQNNFTFRKVGSSHKSVGNF